MATNRLKLIAPLALPAAAAGQLRSLIVAGQLRPNERLRERDLASQLGISRTPLRQALQRLEHERLLSSNSSKGFTVSAFTADEITNIYQSLAALERAALIHTAAVTKDMAARLRSASRRRRAAGADVETSIKADLDWHRALTGFTANEIIREMLEPARRLAERYERAFFSSVLDAQRTTAEHNEIEGAVLAGDLRGAASLVEGHWLGNIPAMVAIIERSKVRGG
jgi:DNA-binding GntR family transcriptional regulator